MTQYEKLKIAMEYYLIGRSYNTAKKAFEFGKSFHTGTRKDGVTPEFQHPLEIAHFLRTFDAHSNFENVLAAAFLHDVREDHDISREELKEKFGEKVYELVWYMSKKFRNDKIHDEEYYRLLGENKDAALLKGVDRINNLKSMSGVFSYEKQRSYVAETQTHVLPMLKKARKNFPEYESYFENVKFIINTIILLLESTNYGDQKSLRVFGT